MAQGNSIDIMGAHTQAYDAPPALATVVDKIGAGDVFNAAMVHALRSGRTLEQALKAAVSLASLQCTRKGLKLASE
jgi:ketohexokinase